LGMDHADDMLADPVVNDLMREAVFQPPVDIASSLQSRLTPVEIVSRTEASRVRRFADGAAYDVALAANSADDCRLAGIAEAPRFALFVPMPVAVAAADICLVEDAHELAEIGLAAAAGRRRSDRTRRAV
jgi:hypothetical protein